MKKMLLMVAVALLALLAGCEALPDMKGVEVAPLSWKDRGQATVVRSLTEHYGATSGFCLTADLIVVRTTVGGLTVVRSDGVVIAFPRDVYDVRDLAAEYRRQFPPGKRPVRNDDRLRKEFGVTLANIDK